MPRKLVATWLGLTITACSIAMLDGGWLASWLALEPRMIWRGEVWRLASWIFFVDDGFMTAIVTCMVIYKFGDELVDRWSERRVLVTMAVVVVAIGVIVSLHALVVGDASVWHGAGMVVIDVLTIAWAREYPDRVIEFWSVIRLRGAPFIGVVIAFTLYYVMRVGFTTCLPELLACGFGLIVPVQRGMSSK